MPGPANALNISQSGLQYFTASNTFSGISTVGAVAGDVLTVVTPGALPSFQPGGIGTYFSVTPYICGPTGDPHAQYTGASAIADAIAQVVTDGVTKATIFIKPGSYGSSTTVTTPANVQISFYGMGNPGKFFIGGFPNTCDVVWNDTVEVDGNAYFENISITNVQGHGVNSMVVFQGCYISGIITNTATGVFFDFNNCTLQGASVIGDGNTLGTVTMSARFLNCYINGNVTTASAGPANTGDYFEFYDCYFGNAGIVTNASVAASAASNPFLICNGCTVASNTWINEDSAHTFFNAFVENVLIINGANTAIAISNTSGGVNYTQYPWNNITSFATTFVNDTSTSSSYAFESCAIRGANINSQCNVFIGDSSSMRVSNSMFNAGVTAANNGKLSTENCITTGTTFVGGTGIQWDNHQMVPSLAATPTAVPIITPSGMQPMVYDTASDNLFLYNSGWKAAYYSLSPYIVGSDVNSKFSTIQAAINQAVSDGFDNTNPCNIYIKPGVYTEDLTLNPGINLIAFNYTSTIVKGKATLATAGEVHLHSMTLETNSDYCLVLSGAAVSKIFLNNCYVLCSDNTGMSITNSDGTSFLSLRQCYTDVTNTGIGLYTFTGAASAFFSNSILRNTANTTTLSTNTGGPVTYEFTESSMGLSASTSGVLTITHCNLYSLAGSFVPITLADSGDHEISHCLIVSNPSVAVTVNSGAHLSIHNTSVQSSVSNPITGTGAVDAGIVVFTASGNGINATTTNKLTVYGGNFI